MPFLHRQFREHNLHLACGAVGIVRVRIKLDFPRILERFCTAKWEALVKEEGVNGTDRLSVDLDADVFPDEVPEYPS